MQLLDSQPSINSKGHLLLLGFVSFSFFLLKLFLFKVIALQNKTSTVGGISLSSTFHYLVAASNLKYIINKKVFTLSLF